MDYALKNFTQPMFIKTDLPQPRQWDLLTMIVGNLCNRKKFRVTLRQITYSVQKYMKGKPTSDLDKSLNYFSKATLLAKAFKQKSIHGVEGLGLQPEQPPTGGTGQKSLQVSENLEFDQTRPVQEIANNETTSIRILYDESRASFCSSDLNPREQEVGVGPEYRTSSNTPIKRLVYFKFNEDSDQEKQDQVQGQKMCGPTSKAETIQKPLVSREDQCLELHREQLRPKAAKVSGCKTPKPPCVTPVRQKKALQPKVNKLLSRFRVFDPPASKLSPLLAQMSLCQIIQRQEEDIDTY